MDLLSNPGEISSYMLPFIAFSVGLVGSTHCITMCGAFSITCSSSRRFNFSYQFGRLSAYFILAGFSYYLGSRILSGLLSEQLQNWAAILLGIALIVVGLSFSGKTSITLPLPKVFENTFKRAWALLLSQKKSLWSSFGIGVLSLTLPCGLLYSVLIPLSAIHSLSLALVCVFMFWLGTLPLMAFATTFVHKKLSSLKSKPKVLLSLFIIVLGITTISSRLTNNGKLRTDQSTSQVCH